PAPQGGARGPAPPAGRLGAGAGRRLLRLPAGRCPLWRRGARQPRLLPAAARRGARGRRRGRRLRRGPLRAPLDRDRRRPAGRGARAHRALRREPARRLDHEPDPTLRTAVSANVNSPPQPTSATPPTAAATRDAYGKALAELGAERTDIVVLDADL